MRHLLLVLLLLLAGATTISPLAAQSEEPVVHAVMFWMEGCGHCDWVKKQTLPPLEEQYGDQLDIYLIQVRTNEEFDQLSAIAAAVGVSESSLGVPFLLIGDAVLIGSEQIPAELPELIEMHLAAGGVDYPDMPGLDVLLPATPSIQNMPAAMEPAAAPVTSNDSPNEAVAPSTETASSPVNNGFALATVVLSGMVIALGYTGWSLLRSPEAIPLSQPSTWRQMALPSLALIGLGVATYLAYVETQAVTAVCGPIGDCNTVQTSEYAYILGIPIGVLGVIGYLAILFIWLWGRWQGNRRASLILLGMTGFGVLFSIYLTYLEPFVIGAVCAWCLASAVIMTVLMLLVLEPAVREMRLIGDSDAGHAL